MREFVLLLCVLVLSAMLIYISDTMLEFHQVAIQVYCEKQEDFAKCAQEFKEKTTELMRKRR